MTSKQAYRQLCLTDDSIPFFSQAWWLDASAGEGAWDVAIVEKNGRIMASLPYVFRRRYGLTKLTQPPLTQTLGPWLRLESEKYSTILSRQKSLMEALIEKLPPFSQYEQSWHHSQTNWLPFFWKGFQQTTRYTYVLPCLEDELALWNGLRSNIRTDIGKASEREAIKIRTDLGLPEFSALNKKVFERQGLAQPYSDLFLKRIDDACLARGKRRIFIAEDVGGRHHAAAYVVWDSNSAYYLMGGGDPALRNSGATSLCMWAAIKFAATVTRSFDFEGSMLMSVERFFRAFGAQQTPYFAVSKTSSRLLRLYKACKEIKLRKV